MEVKDIEKMKKELVNITLIQMRDPKFNSKMTELYVLIGDLVTMVRRPINTLPLLKAEVKSKLSHRIIVENRQTRRNRVKGGKDE